MKKTGTKLIILYTLTIAIIVIAITSVSIAFWGGNPSKSVDGLNSPTINGENTTYKYLIFKAIYSEGDYYLKYSDSSKKFEGYDLYGEGLPSGITKESFSTVSLYGYVGALGEYEDLVIPKQIVWKISSEENKDLSVTEIDIATADFLESLSLIKSVVIPDSVKNIRNSSFTACPQLTIVYFDSTTVPTVDQYALIGNISFKKKDSLGNYVDATISRS